MVFINFTLGYVISDSIALVTRHFLSMPAYHHILLVKLSTGDFPLPPDLTEWSYLTVVAEPGLKMEASGKQKLGTERLLET